MKIRTAESILSTPQWAKLVGYMLAVVLLIFVVLGIYWSRMPDVFWVTHSVDEDRIVVGYSTTDTLIRVAETLLEKPGGYLSNDRMPPTVLLDNIPNWEFGVLQQVRDMARVIRNDYSRSQSQSKEDEDVAASEPRFFFDNNSWFLPPTESEYRDAIRGFQRYRDRLSGAEQPEALFLPALITCMSGWVRSRNGLAASRGDLAIASRLRASTLILRATRRQKPQAFNSTRST